MSHSFCRSVCLVLFLAVSPAPAAGLEEDDFTPLFPHDGIPEGWVVRQWNDVSQPADDAVHWHVKEGILHGGEPRGTWLISEKEYGDFVLTFDFQLPERGNSGLGLRFPPQGDPAFDGIELQMVDLRYYGDAAPQIPASELTGGLYRAVAPTEQRYRPGEWNSYVVTVRGATITVELNGKTIQTVNLDHQTTAVERHDGTAAAPLKDRPRQGRIGFQDLSRGGGHVAIRNARIRRLE